jgi:hypothetical protein
MSLTGRPDGPPLGAPGALVDLVQASVSILRVYSNGGAEVDGLALLGERAALGGLTRRGDVSCGGGTRLLRAVDGWVAVCLARRDDVLALPAWLQCDIPEMDPWPVLAERVAERSMGVLDERAALLSLPIAALGSVPPPVCGAFGLPVAGSRIDSRNGKSLKIVDATVVDLSTLWAGPLCGQLLSHAGATVIKVESIARPDAARGGDLGFFDLLNGAKRSVALDLRTPSGRRDLRSLLGAADVVIESARPRALEQMGIDALDELRRAGGPKVWASITSHGRSEDARHRVGFGDVAAVAGGLVSNDAQGPCFVADAVADPVTGLVTAAAVLEALDDGGRWLLDAALAPLAASIAGPPLDVKGLEISVPRARRLIQGASRLGADTADVVAQFAS